MGENHVPLDADEKRRRLAQLLAERAGVRQYPASFTQEALWFLNRLDQAQTAYSLFPAVRIRGPLRVDVLERVLNEIRRRHEILRTRFPEQNGVPIQWVEPFAPLRLALIDLSHLDEASQRRETRRLSLEQPHIDLRKDLPVGGRLIRWGPEDHILLFYIHHILFDGWSFSLATQEVAALYPAFLRGAASPLPDLPLQYGDFALWQRQHLSGERLALLDAYWTRQLAGLRPLEMPTDFPRPPIRSTHGNSVAVAIPPELNRRLIDFARQEGVTLYMVLLAAFAETLHRFSGATDIAVGSPIANRRRREFEPLIGYFINMVVMRNDLSGDPSFRGLLGQVRQTFMGAFDHQDLPLDRVVKQLAPPRDLSRHPLFQVMFVLQNTLPPQLEIGDLRMETVPGSGEDQGTIFELTMEWRLEGGELRGRLGYSADLFSPATIKGVAAQYRGLLERVVNEPQRPLSEIASLGAAELRWLARVERGVGTSSAEAADSFPNRFRQQVAATPDAPALVDGDRCWTYTDLDRRAGALARRLRGLGAGPGSLVAVWLPRSAEAITALLGVLQSGAAYVPLDIGLPSERVAGVLEDAAPSILITQSSQGMVWAGRVEHLVLLDAGADAPAGDSPLGDIGPLPTPSPGDLAYVIYTSGSTGRPKGVQIEHRALLQYALGAVACYGIRSGDRVLQFASLSYDGHVEEVYATLLAGGALILRDDRMLDSLQAFLAGCAQAQIQVLSLPTGFWHELTYTLERSDASLPESLRVVIIGGEAVLPERIRAWFRRAPPRVQLINSYGPTETTVVATAVELTAAHGEQYRPPIGRPLPHVRVKVVDRFGHRVPVGAPGELLIGGAAVARGYLGNAGLTRQVFIETTEQHGLERWYRSGDRARWRRDGLLEFLGRGDEQVKVRGFRVEPAEVEAALAEHPLVNRAVVLPFNSPTGGQRLGAYVAADAGLLDASELRTFLQARIPEFMIPAVFVPMTELPLNTSGKVERERLPPLEAAGAWRADAPAAPRSATEHAMLRLWQEVLGIDPIGIHDDFFQLGGDSLSALRLLGNVREHFKLDVGLGTLFAEPTPARLAEQVDRDRALGVLPEAPPIMAVLRDAPLPLSLEQEHFYFLTQINPGTAAYNLHTRLRLDGVLDLDALTLTLREVIRRHEPLRTRFALVDDRPVQVVMVGDTLDWGYQDLSGLDDDRQAPVVERIARDEATSGFDLAARPPLRMRLLRLRAQRHLLLLTAHHILVDAWSLPILAAEVELLYSAFSRSQPITLRNPAIQFADFAAWQRRHLQGATRDALMEYWRCRLAGLKPLALPSDRPRPAGALRDSRVYRFRVDPQRTAQARAGARQGHGTLFLVLLTAFKLLLHRYSGQPDFAVGVPVSGRGRREVEQTIGCFVNTLVMRTRFDGNPTAGELLRRVRATAGEAFAHQELPLHLLVQELRPERELGRNPLFQTLFNFLQGPEPLRRPRAEIRLSLDEPAVPPHSGELDLVLTVGDDAQGLEASLGYNAELFDDATIARLATHWMLALDYVAGDPSRHLAGLALVTEAERRHLLEDWKTPPMVLPWEPLHRLFLTTAAVRPDAVALLQAGRQTSYRELAVRAEGVAALLLRQGLEPEELVAVCLPPSPALPAALFGVLLAGGALLPMDPQTPPERLDWIVRQARVRWAIADDRERGLFPSDQVRVLSVEPPPQGVPPPARFPLVALADLAYCLFTSGSTGLPKGVLVEHRSLLNSVCSFIQCYRLGAEDRVLHQTSLSFDVALNEVLAPLCAGATLVLPEGSERWDVDAVADMIEGQAVTIIAGPPALLAHLDERAGQMPSLRLVLSGGESLSYRMVDRLVRHATVTNGYGPTETTICASYFDLSSAPLPTAGGKVPIGRPLANYSIYVLDEYGQLAPIGVPGELCIGGYGVARGYLDAPEEQVRCFVPDPFHAEERMYRSGDLGRWRADGQLEFLGRMDRQIKVRGVRVEPAETEAAILQHPAILHAVVVSDDAGRLVAYLTPTPDVTAAAGFTEASPVTDVAQQTAGEWGSSDALVEDIRQRLRALLPPQYWPSEFRLVERLPQTITGKVDQAALSGMPTQRWGRTASSRPATPAERRIGAIWAEQLQLAEVSREDDFFSLGGHSLLAVETVARVNALWNSEVPVAILFESPRLADFATRVDAWVAPRTNTGDTAPPVLFHLNRGDEGAPLFCVHGVGGQVSGFWGLAHRLAPRPFYALGGLGMRPDEPPQDTIEAMAETCLFALRAAQPAGPYLLAGWSMGGWIATEMARQLRCDGGQVRLLILIDPPLLARERRRAFPWVDGIARTLEAGMGQALGALTSRQLERMMREYAIASPADAVFVQQIRRMVEAHSTALSNYRPAPYDGPTLHCRASGAPPEAQMWRELFPLRQVRDLNGDHFSILQEPAVSRLATALQTAIETLPAP